MKTDSRQSQNGSLGSGRVVCSRKELQGQIGKSHEKPCFAEATSGFPVFLPRCFAMTFFLGGGPVDGRLGFGCF